jgi:hypothetical protein
LSDVHVRLWRLTDRAVRAERDMGEAFLTECGV